MGGNLVTTLSRNNIDGVNEIISASGVDFLQVIRKMAIGKVMDSTTQGADTVDKVRSYDVSRFGEEGHIEKALIERSNLAEEVRVEIQAAKSLHDLAARIILNGDNISDHTMLNRKIRTALEGIELSTEQLDVARAALVMACSKQDRTVTTEHGR